MISIILPIIRPKKAARCLELINKNAGVTDYEIIAEHDTDGIGCPKMVKKLVDKANGEYICFLGDDTLPQENFLSEAIQCMWETFQDQWGLVGLNDGTGRNWLPTHWLAHTNLLDHLENREFFYTGYTHCYCDMELKDKAENLNRYIYCYKSLVYHEHPAINVEGVKRPQTDEHYERVYKKEVRDKDRDLYYSRKLGRACKTTEIKCPKCKHPFEVVDFIG